MNDEEPMVMGGTLEQVVQAISDKFDECFECCIPLNHNEQCFWAEKNHGRVAVRLLCETCRLGFLLESNLRKEGALAARQVHDD